MRTFDVPGRFSDGLFRRLTTFGSQIEVPHVCYVERALGFTYNDEELFVPNSGWWVVAYTEFVSRVKAA